MASRDLGKLHPRLRAFVLKLISLAWERYKIKVVVTNVSRDIHEQSALYAQGRKTLDEVNTLRRIAGMYPISQSDNEKCVTWTMRSLHIIDKTDDIDENDVSRAVDIAIMNDSNRISWSIKTDVNKDNFPDYVQLVKLAGEIDPEIECGGNWKTPDYPHYQYKPKKGVQR